MHWAGAAAACQSRRRTAASWTLPARCPAASESTGTAAAGRTAAVAGRTAGRTAGCTAVAVGTAGCTAVAVSTADRTAAVVGTADRTAVVNTALGGAAVTAPHTPAGGPAASAERPSSHHVAEDRGTQNRRPKRCPARWGWGQ